MDSLIDSLNSIFEFIFLRNFYTVLLVLFPFLYYYAVKFFLGLMRTDPESAALPKLDPEDEKMLPEMSPGMLRYILKGRYDPLCFVADLIQLYEAGLVKFHFRSAANGFVPYFPESGNFLSGNILEEVFCVKNLESYSTKPNQYNTFFFYRLVSSFTKLLKKKSGDYVLSTAPLSKIFVLLGLLFISLKYFSVFFDSTMGDELLFDAVHSGDGIEFLMFSFFLAALQLLFFIFSYNLSKLIICNSSVKRRYRLKQRPFWNRVILFFGTGLFMWLLSGFNVVFHFTAPIFFAVLFKLESELCFRTDRGKALSRLILSKYEDEECDTEDKSKISEYVARRVALDQMDKLNTLPGEVKKDLELFTNRKLFGMVKKLGYDKTPVGVVNALENWADVYSRIRLS